MRLLHQFIVLATAGAPASLAPSVAQAAWWSTGTNVQAMCENNDGGVWNPGNHGGISGWCSAGNYFYSGSANNYIMNVRMDRDLYVCINGWYSGANGNGACVLNFER